MYQRNTVWAILYCASKDLIPNFHQNLICFWCSKILSKNCIRDNMVWPILSFQGSYVNVYLSHIYFLVLKMSWRVYQGQCCLTVIFLFKDSIKFSLKAHAFFVSKVFNKFESWTTWFDLYHTFRKHWSIFMKSTMRSR